MLPLPKLQSLTLHGSGTTDVGVLPSLARLRSLVLSTLRGLTDLAPIGTAPALEELLLIGMKHLEPDDVRCLTTCRTLQRALVNLGSVRKNAAANRVLGLPFADRCGFELR